MPRLLLAGEGKNFGATTATTHVGADTTEVSLHVPAPGRKVYVEFVDLDQVGAGSLTLAWKTTGPVYTNVVLPLIAAGTKQWGPMLLNGPADGELVYTLITGAAGSGTVTVSGYEAK